jgi:hypothetical protein
MVVKEDENIETQQKKTDREENNLIEVENREKLKQTDREEKTL